MAAPQAADAAPEIDWRSIDYAAVIEQRGRRLEALRKDPELLLASQVYYRDNPADWLLIRPEAVAEGEIFRLRREAVVGTSANRRKAQLLAFRAGTQVEQVGVLHRERGGVTYDLQFQVLHSWPNRHRSANPRADLPVHQGRHPVAQRAQQRLRDLVGHEQDPDHSEGDRNR